MEGLCSIYRLATNTSLVTADTVLRDDVYVARAAWGRVCCRDVGGGQFQMRFFAGGGSGKVASAKGILLELCVQQIAHEMTKVLRFPKSGEVTY